MKTNTTIGAILIIVSLAMGYFSFNKISESTTSVNLMGLKVEASDDEGKAQGYILLGLAVVLFGGGVYTLRKTK